MATPNSVRVNSPNDSFYTTAEALTDKALFGIERRQTLVDVIQLAAPGRVVSAVIPPQDAVVAITGVAVQHTAITAGATAFVEGTTRGNMVMGTADLAYGAYIQVSPAVTLNAGTPAATIPSIAPPDMNWLLVNGDGINPLWAAQAPLLAPPDAVSVFIYYIASFGKQLTCS